MLIKSIFVIFKTKQNRRGQKMRADRKVRNNLRLLAGDESSDNGNKKVLLVIARKFKHPISVAADTIQEITNLGLTCTAEPFNKEKSYQTREDISLVLFFTKKRKVVLMRGV